MKFITFDPGESTGYSCWEDGVLVTAGTCSLDDASAALGVAFGVTGPGVDADRHLVECFRGAGHVVIEEWKIYPWAKDELVWDECRTAGLIGALEYICLAGGIPFTEQGASIKDEAVALGAEEKFLRPLDENRHANDAIMHGVVYKAAAGA